MKKIVNVNRVGFWKKLADMLMVPIMYLISGTFAEKPQRTHAWNIQNFSVTQAQMLSEKEMVSVKGLRNQLKRHYGFLFHMPIFGGWRHFVVIQPLDYQGVWHVGWQQKNVQISILPLVGPVRLLVGSSDVKFFGINSQGCQIPIQQIGTGKIGDRGIFAKVPLS